MIYFFPLKWVALTVGALLLISHLPGIISPKWYGAFLRPLPRNRILGTLVMGAATGWFCWVTSVVDLGDMFTAREYLISAWALSGASIIIFVPLFLFPRGLGCILLLSASVLLDSAFLVDTQWRYLITLLAYAWIIAGIVLVYSPYYMRDLLTFAFKTPSRALMLCWPGAIYGVLLIIVALVFYP